jgi:hypothetical protein
MPETSPLQVLWDEDTPFKASIMLIDLGYGINGVVSESASEAVVRLTRHFADYVSFTSWDRIQA